MTAVVPEVDEVDRSAVLLETVSTSQLSSSDRASIVWDAVYRARSEVTDDADARELADQVVKLLDQGEQFNAEEIERSREDRAYRKQEQRKRLWSKIGEGAIVLGIVLLVVGALVNVIYWPLETHSNDYAHVDPGTVPAQALTTVQKYIGQKNMPAQMTLVKKKHSLYDGKHAWYVLYRTSSGKSICTYIWSGSHGDYGRVFQGSGCVASSAVPTSPAK